MALLIFFLTVDLTSIMLPALYQQLSISPQKWYKDYSLSQLSHKYRDQPGKVSEIADQVTVLANAYAEQKKALHVGVCGIGSDNKAGRYLEYP